MKYFPAKKPSAIKLYQGDIPGGLKFSNSVAIDTEAQGLNPMRDRLCVAQLSSGDGVCHLVQFSPNSYDAPNLRALLTHPDTVKVFHFARFDLAILKKYLDVDVSPVYCTKIASKLVRTYTDRHGLKDVTKELLDIDLSKEKQSSDWASKELSAGQLRYAAADVLNLHAIRERLDVMLEREGRMDLARQCFDFLATRAELDLNGWSETDIFSH